MPKLTLPNLLLSVCILFFSGTVFTQESVSESVTSWQTPEDIDWASDFRRNIEEQKCLTECHLPYRIEGMNITQLVFPVFSEQLS